METLKAASSSSDATPPERRVVGTLNRAATKSSAHTRSGAVARGSGLPSSADAASTVPLGNRAFAKAATTNTTARATPATRPTDMVRP